MLAPRPLGMIAALGHIACPLASPCLSLGLLRKRVPIRTLECAAAQSTQGAYDSLLAADRRELLSFFPTVVRDVQADSLVVGIPQQTEWVKKLMHYVVPGGRLFRGCSALNACRELLPPDRAAALGKPLGLAAEMLQGLVIIMDDLMDGAGVRRGQPSWHTLPGVGLHSINDAFILYTAMFKVLKRYFAEEPSYPRLFELFNESFFRAALAQNFECHNGSPDGGAIRFDAFDHEVHATQARFKLGYYTFYKPPAAAMLLANTLDRARHDTLWRLAQDIGQLFAVQDDYSDCYESPEVSGKTQCDIRNGKCTWLVAESKRRASPEQLAVLKKNYGFNDDERVAIVMDLYGQLGIEEAIREWIRNEYVRIGEEVDRQRDIPPGVLHYVLAGMQQPLPQP